MTVLFRRSLFLVAGLGFLFLGAGVPKERSNTVPDKLNKTAISVYKFFDVNSLNCTISSEGPYCDDRRTNNSGLEWPKGSGKTSVFTAGIWVIGKHMPDGGLRTAVEDYSTEYQPGPILTTFNTTTNSKSAAADPTDAKYTLYKINKKDTVGGVNSDYDNWPGDLGAPYIDVNGNGQWDKGIDKPKFWGDQQLWCVYNDCDIAKHSPVGVTAPMGLEVQTTYFGFDRSGTLGNIMFMRWKIINKSDADYNEVYISMWSDTDLGDANDDLAGVDSVLSLGFVYNGDNDDGTTHGYGSQPPAGGFDFFEGPIVAGAATDTALFEGKKKGGYKNLPAASHSFYINGADPTLGNAQFAQKAYAFQTGINGQTLLPYINPLTNQPSKFVFSGDPVAGTGWLPAASGVAPGDVRSMISAGPFTLAKGDTQEIVGGYVIAQGSDRLQSVALLKKYDAVAQDAFDANFNLPSPPPAPVVQVSELPNEVVLDWSKNASATESYDFKSNRFQGYVVYQGESVNGPWHRLAVYDKIDGIKTVLDYQSDPVTGLNLLAPVAFGTDAGITRYYRVTQDAITLNPLVNGKEYYFTVTGYSYNEDPQASALGLTLVLEDSKTPITVIPRGVAIGNTQAATTNQLISNERSLHGDDALVAQVISPSLLKGDKYEISFNGSPATSWNIVRDNGGAGVSFDSVLKASNNFTVGTGSPIFDGLQFQLTAPAPGIRRDTQTPKGYSYSPAANLWFGAQTTNGMQAFGATTSAGALAYPDSSVYTGKKTKVKTTDLQKVEIRFSNTTTQKAYRYLVNVRTGPGSPPIRDSSFIPFVINRGPGYAYQDFVDVPFTVWEVDSLDGSPAPRQLAVGFTENNDSLYNGLGNINGKWGPTTAANGGREVLYIFQSTYSPTPLSTYTRNSADTTKIMDLFASQDSTDLMYLVWVKSLTAASTFTEGDKFIITPNYVLSNNHKFTVTAPKATTGDKTLIKQQAARINVFPNPYFASNLAETSPLQRFVTFSNLPSVATIRIFTITGELVKSISHNNTTGFEKWDLRNEHALPVASGMYLAYVSMPGAGNVILKIAIIQPEERPARL